MDHNEQRNYTNPLAPNRPVKCGRCSDRGFYFQFHTRSYVLCPLCDAPAPPVIVARDLPRGEA